MRAEAALPVRSHECGVCGTGCEGMRAIHWENQPERGRDERKGNEEELAQSIPCRR